jgi:hypothetical protein
MQKRRITKMLILFTAFYLINLINSPLSYSQTRKPTIMIKLDRENEHWDKWKGFTNLYTIINGRQYFIDRLERTALILPEPVIDPTGSYVFYAGNTGCGFEQEGMTIFVADVYGKKKYPILGRCWGLAAEGFLSFQGKNYLLITQTSEGPEQSFWLYDIGRGEFVLHANGGITEIKKGVFSYGYSDGNTEFTQIGMVTMRTLIRNRPPLKLLPKYSTHGITKQRNLWVYPAIIECEIDSDKPYKQISKRGTRVLILHECEDGGYEIYYDGFRGKVKKGAIRPTKLTP